MSSPVVIRVSHRYSTPAERVFDAWLTPNQAARFLFRTRTGNVMQCEIQPEVGGGFTVIDRRPAAEGDESVFDVVHMGKYLEIDRPRRLVFTWGIAGFSVDETDVTVEIVPLESGCELTLTHRKVWSEYAERTQSGWTTMVEALARELDNA